VIVMEGGFQIPEDLMAVRQLGTSGLTTPPLILGGNVFGWTHENQLVACSRVHAILSRRSA
jgi:aryl-alcohol dehydrogenase-like predicted oxidoreductase